MCHLTPDQVDALSVRDFHALCAFAEAYNEAQEGD